MGASAHQEYISTVYSFGGIHGFSFAYKICGIVECNIFGVFSKNVLVRREKPAARIGAKVMRISSIFSLSCEFIAFG